MFSLSSPLEASAQVREQISEEGVRQLQKAKRPLKKWRAVKAAMRAIDLNALDQALLAAAAERQNKGVAARQRILVLRGLVLMARSYSLTLQGRYLVETGASDTDIQSVLLKRRKLVPEIQHLLTKVLDFDLPTLATLLPTEVNDWTQITDDDKKMLHWQHAGVLPTWTSRRAMSAACDREGLTRFVSLVLSVHPDAGVRRSPLTTQVMIDRDAYQLLLTGALIQTAEAGPQSSVAPLIHKGLNRACKRLRARGQKAHESWQMLQLCEVVTPTH